MLLLAFVAFQAADPPPNLARSLISPSERCTEQPTNGEVVVCGRREGQNPYRIGPQQSVPPLLPDAEFRISDGVEAKLSAEQGAIGGIPTNRAMVTFKIRF